MPTLSSSPHSFSKYPIAYLELRVFSHATEDQEKVQTAVRNILPEALAAELVFAKTSLLGHHGNPILLLEAKLTNKEQLPLMLQKIGSALNSMDKQELSDEIDKHIEKHNLYLRLNKQDALLGTVKLGSMDPIHLKFHFKNRAAAEIIEICQQAGLLP